MTDAASQFRPTTELEKVEMKKKFIYLANRLKCRYSDHGGWISIEIRPMTQRKDDNANTTDTTTA